MRSLAMLVFLCTTNLSAQQAYVDQTSLPPCHRPTDEVKAVLNLDDNQLNALEALKVQRHEAQAPIVSQLRDKWRALNEALTSGQTDAAALGQMLMDIENLRVQRRNNDSRYDERALAVLTADQRDKLKKLGIALKFQPAARQAVWLGLLDMPKEIHRAEEADDSDPDSGLF